MSPSTPALPITPMLDMSFQLLFFFICIYKPPLVQEAQFLLNLHPPSKGETEQQPPPPADKDKLPFDEGNKIVIGHNIQMTVRTYIGQGERGGDADYLISRIRIAGIPPKAKAVLFPNDPTREPVTLPVDGAPGLDASPEQEKAILESLAPILKEARDRIPAEAAPPRVVIRAPRGIRMSKIVRLMDYCNDAGFGVSLQLLDR